MIDKYEIGKMIRDHYYAGIQGIYLGLLEFRLNKDGYVEGILHFSKFFDSHSISNPNRDNEITGRLDLSDITLRSILKDKYFDLYNLVVAQPNKLLKA